MNNIQKLQKRYENEMSLQKIEYSKNSMDTDENSFSMKVDKIIQKLKELERNLIL